jgi:hypothetical protein
MQIDIYEKYGVSAKNGFLPDGDPLIQLSDHFEAWDAIGKELPNLILAESLKSELEKMPILVCSSLQSEQEY